MTSHACTDLHLPPLKLLVQGPPRVGKTTVMRRLVELLHEHGAVVGGFLTHEVRDGGQRVGFVVRDLAGPEAVLAHRDFQSSVQVGRYGVDVSAFEQVALPALRGARERGGVVVIDELGRMELASSAFVTAVHDLFGDQFKVVATVHVHAHAVTDALKQRADVQRVIVTEANRDELPYYLFGRLMNSAGRVG